MPFANTKSRNPSKPNAKHNMNSPTMPPSTQSHARALFFF